MTPFTPPDLRARLPTYPLQLQALRLTGGTTAGPVGGPSILYNAYTQQLDPTTLLPRDREACLAVDMNGDGLPPGYYTNCRLASSYNLLPVYEIATAVSNTSTSIRVTEGTIPGPSGYASSSVIGPSLYIAYTQTLNPETLLLEDDEPVLVMDLNHIGIAPGYYTSGNSTSSYQSLRVYELGTAPVSPLSFLSIGPHNIGRLTDTQINQLNTLSLSQRTVLNNITPCQLQTLIDAIPISEIHTLTNVLNPTRLATLIGQLTVTQLTDLYTQLTTSQIITLTSTLTQQQIYTLVGVLTPAKIQELITGLTTTQLLTLSNMTPNQAKLVTNNLTVPQLATLLDVSPAPPFAIPSGINPQTGTTYTITPSDNGKLVTFTNSSTVATTIPNANTVGPGFITSIQNLGTGTVTLTPLSGTIDGLPTVQIPHKQGLILWSDGSNWKINTPVAHAFTAGVKLQTDTTYAVLYTDIGKLITFDNNSGIAVTLGSASSLGKGFEFIAQNIGTGTATITPSSGSINGSASLELDTDEGAIIRSDGTDWFAVTGKSTGGSAARTEGTLGATGTGQGDAAQIVTDAVDVSGADGNKGVILPNTTAGIITVYNGDVAGLKVYPPSGAQIGTLGTNNPFTLTSGTCIFYRISSTQWAKTEHLT